MIRDMTSGTPWKQIIVFALPLDVWQCISAVIYSYGFHYCGPGGLVSALAIGRRELV